FFLAPLRSVLYVCAPTDTYTLSLHDALPISAFPGEQPSMARLYHPPIDAPPGVEPSHARLRQTTDVVTLGTMRGSPVEPSHARLDRKSTRLNSSHVKISYAVFCLKKKNKEQQ